MPNRVIKDSILKSKSLARLKPYYQDQFPRWLLMADDWGCFDCDVDIIKGLAYPKRKETIKDVLKIRDEFYKTGHLFVWDDGDREWAFFVKWDLHQYVGSIQYDNTGKRARHRRKTPEPPKELLKKYLEKFPKIYGTKGNDVEQNGTKRSIPNPIPNPNPKVAATKKPVAPTQELLQYFGLKYEKAFKATYPANFGKDGKIFKDLLNAYDTKFIKDCIDVAFDWAQEEDCWFKDKLDIGIFKSQLSKIIIKMRRDYE